MSRISTFYRFSCFSVYVTYLSLGIIKFIDTIYYRKFTKMTIYENIILPFQNYN